jgi:hypothetical protein
VQFGRQQNLVRRAVRPHGREVRQLRRRGVGKATLLDVQSQAGVSLWGRMLRRIARLVRRS